MYDDWESITQSTVAALRARVGPDVDDARLNELEPIRRIHAD